MKVIHSRYIICERNKNKVKLDNIVIGMVVKDMTIIREINKKDRKYYECRCRVCGRIRISRSDAIKRHIGMKHKYCTQLIEDIDKQFYRKWMSMRTRTSNSKDPDYDYYGGRGISSEYYKYFVDFYDDLYYSYKEHCKIHGKKNTTLDRIDVDKSYTSDNVRWATRELQAQNTRQCKKIKVLTPDNDTLIFNSLSECSRFFKTTNSTILRRINSENNIKTFKLNKNIDGYTFHIL